MFLKSERKHNFVDCVLQEVTQKDTIYEALRYRFESDSFDTVPDLITYHVGGNLAISASSGAVISHPKFVKLCS